MLRQTDRKSKSIKNMFWLLVQQIIAVIYGLIAPALIIRCYGSAVNGVISSITQFLNYITLLESGVGSVITSALYQPLASNDKIQLSKIVVSANRFFKKLAYIFLVYLLFVAIAYPYIVEKEMGFLFTFSLVIILSVSTFAQYYFGVTYQILIEADQKSWIVAMLQSVTYVLVLIITIVSIKIGISIHMLKIICAGVYVIRPVLLNVYVKKKYSINLKIAYDKEVIKQKWDGLAHHIAFIIHYNTDITVLTIFTNVLEVSVYSVYYNIISNVYKIVNSVTAGIKASVGNIIALGETEKLKKVISEYETLNFIMTTVLYSCAIVLIVPFVKIYTSGINDVNYIRPYFAILIVLAEAMYGLRNPYDMVIFAAGHFKQTKTGAFWEAGINILISVSLVNIIGMEGVAIGTLAAMLFRCIQYVYYLKNNIMFRPVNIFFRKFIVNLAAGIGLVFIASNVKCTVNSYEQWLLYALIIVSIFGFAVIGVNYIFFRKDFEVINELIRVK
ncbi:MAG: polysaccharide biosynthesis C-terminal domain-containing protein [Clostridiales bacterium]|nr:polysaccharide biosynthesis C-terminal domain-containing protein [Clostridiales bacterium]